MTATMSSTALLCVRRNCSKHAWRECGQISFAITCDLRANILPAGPAPYLQCGGSGGDCKSPGGVCKDVAWPDFKCAGDFVCNRINAYYW